MTTPKDTWISVKDAMPDLNKQVLIYHKSGLLFIDEVKEENGIKYFKNPFKNNPITHWMLLSKPKNK